MTSITALPNASIGHSRLSPSGAHRWMSCPGSVVLESAFPNKSSSYADDGTACHDVAAWCLVNHRQARDRVGDYIVVSHGEEERRAVEFTPEMAELVQVYVDAIRYRTSAPSAVLWVEQHVDLSTWLGVEDQGGTADAAILVPYTGPDAQPGDLELEIHDLKAGRSPVSADTPQLPLYALGFITALVQGKAPEAVRPLVLAAATRPSRRVVNSLVGDDE